jgi:hypothetical protein
MGFFHRNQKTLIWIIVIIIVPAFGVSGLLVALSSRGDNRTFGTFNGQAITADVLRAHAARHGLGSKASWEQLAGHYMNTQVAIESGLKVSDKEVIAYVKENPAFKDDNGRYDPERFKKYVESSKVSRDVLFEGMREKLIAEKASDRGERGLLRQPTPIANEEILFRFHKDKDQYKVKYAMFPVKDLEASEAPAYDRIKSIYTQARNYLEANDLKDEEFFRNFPIQDKILKQWVIVEYLSIDKMAVHKALEVDEFEVQEYYNRNKHRYIIKDEEEDEEDAEETTGEAPPEDAEKDEPEEPKEPQYRPLDEVSKLIEGILIDKEANQIMEQLKRNVERKRIEAENRDEYLTLKELARQNFFREIEAEEGYIKDTSKKIVRFNLSDPIELPNFMNARDGLTIDPRLGALPADYQYLYG